MNQLSQDFGAAQSMRPAPVWLLLGTRRGDTNQLYALARELGLPFEDKTLTYNRLRHLPFLRGAGLLMLTRESRRLLAPPWPRLVIGVGYASVWVARAIRRHWSSTRHGGSSPGPRADPHVDRGCGA